MNHTDQLREKIKSKMEVSKYFTGFITISTGLAFNKINGDSYQKLVWFEKLFVGFGLFSILISLGLCIAAMYAYDRLLMPFNFWRKPDKLTNEKQEHPLYLEMIKAWNWLFSPAVICFFISILIFEYIILKDPYITIASALGLIFVVIIYKNYSNIGKDIH